MTSPPPDSRCSNPKHLMGDGDGSGKTKATDWNVDRYINNAAFVSELGKTLLELLKPRAGERILDVGCGDGLLTAELQARGCEVVGIDFAPDMVAASTKRGVEAYVMDAAAMDIPFLLSRVDKRDKRRTDEVSSREEGGTAEGAARASGDSAAHQGDDHWHIPPGDGLVSGLRGTYDAVFTNAALHWIQAPLAVLGGVKRLLRPGGRFVGEFGGHGNISGIRVALHAVLRRRGLDPTTVDPWFYPTAAEYRALLEEAGFVVDWVKLIPRPTALPAGKHIKGWLATFSQAFCDAVGVEGSEAGGESGANIAEAGSYGLTASASMLLDEVVMLLEPSLRDSEGVWTIDYVRLRFGAHLPDD